MQRQACGSFVTILWFLLLSGCSVYMAATQPGQKNLNVLKPGTPRILVLAELGAPVWSGERDESKVDVFAFTQGYSKVAKGARAVFHGVADIFTIGLWEVAGTPIEMIASGTDTKIEVTYDKDDLVKTVKSLEVKKEGEMPAAPLPLSLPPDYPAGGR